MSQGNQHETSSVKLYEMRQAPNPRRVKIFLAEKAITVETVEINIQAGEHLASDFLAINSRGILPSLQLDDGTVIDESVAICRYFEEQYPEPNLMGHGPLESATIEQWQRRIEFDGFSAAASVYRNTSKYFINHAVPGNGPETVQIPALAERGARQLKIFFDGLDKQLAVSHYVAGDRFSIADITAMITVDFSRWVKLTPGLDLTHIKRWHDEISARPSYLASL